MQDVLAEYVRRAAERTAALVDATCVEALVEYGCEPGDLAIQDEFEGVTHVVRVLGPPEAGAPRPLFKELRFDYSRGR